MISPKLISKKPACRFRKRLAQPVTRSLKNLPGNNRPRVAPDGVRRPLKPREILTLSRHSNDRSPERRRLPGAGPGTARPEIVKSPQPPFVSGGTPAGGPANGAGP